MDATERIRAAAFRAEAARTEAEERFGPWHPRTVEAREAAGLAILFGEAIPETEAAGGPQEAIDAASLWQAEQAERLADEAERAAGTRERGGAPLVAVATLATVPVLAAGAAAASEAASAGSTGGALLVAGASVLVSLMFVLSACIE